MKLGLLAEFRGGRGPRGFQRPYLLLGKFSNAYKMLKNGKKLQYYLITGPKLGRGEGSAEVQPKAQV